MPLTTTRAHNRKVYGDFQTPLALVDLILETLEATGDRPARVLEPTCGEGRFLDGWLDRPDRPREIRGFEIQPVHAEIARSIRDSTGLTLLDVVTADLFATDLRRDLPWRETGPLLVVGNLPWVTTAELGAVGGANGPARSNHRKRRGIDAMTGESNFDISEAIWYKLIRELESERPTIALLCKTAVARAVLRSIRTADLPITRATIWKIDSIHWFKAAVDACLFRVEVGPGPRAAQALVYSDLTSKVPEATLGLVGDRLIADIDRYRRVAFADGPSPLEWRQGVKHDASSVMELMRSGDGSYWNKQGEVVPIEAEFLYPLRKATDLATSRDGQSVRFVIVTQRGLGDDTRELEQSAPKLWEYLQSHREAFERRKSSIYRGRPPFVMFGVGNYSFAPYKVAISGLHKSPRFRLVEPVEGRPTMVDDTCYFLPCRTLEQARLVLQALESPTALELLASLIFLDSKRPVTKGLLQRLDLRRIFDHEGLSDHWQTSWETDWIRTSRSVISLDDPVLDDSKR